MKKLDSRFFEVLSKVRGFRNFSDLKEITISLMFLKYANEKYDPDFYNEVEVPECANLDFLKMNINHFDFPNKLWSAFDILESENHFLLGTFSVFDFRYMFNQHVNRESIIDIFKKVIEYDFFNNGKTFSEVVGDFLKWFSEYEGKRDNGTITPESVSELMVELLNPNRGSVLDSACGSGGFFEKIVKTRSECEFSFYGQERNVFTLAIARLRFAFEKNFNVEFGKVENTLLRDSFPDLKADYVLMNPPFVLRNWKDEGSEFDPRFKYGIPPKSNANYAWIQHAIAHLNKHGKAAILLSVNSLFSTGREEEIRKNIVDADLVESIILLPSQLFVNTSIPACIWILNKNKVHKDETLFIDASAFGESTSRRGRNVISQKGLEKITTLYRAWLDSKLFQVGHVNFFSIEDLSSIRKKHYNLSPVKYVTLGLSIGEDLSDTVLLGEVLKSVSPSRINKEGKQKLLSANSLCDHPDNYVLDVNKLKEESVRPNYRVLKSGVLLISRIIDNIRPTYFENSDLEVAYLANSIFAYKVDEKKVSIEYLVAELYKDYVKKQLSALRRGMPNRLARRVDIENVRVKIPSLKEQKLIVEQEREFRFQAFTKELGFQNEIQKLKEAQMKDLGAKQHNIRQHLNNVKASADNLVKMMNRNNGVLNAQDVINPKTGVSVEKRFQRLQESLTKVIFYVDELTNNRNFQKAETFNVIKFLEECKERGIQEEYFEVEILTDNESLEKMKPLINISKDDLEEVYNNLLRNAIRHGFVDKNKKYIFRIIVSLVNDVLEVTFENNGKPFPKGLEGKYFVKGEKAGKTGNTGLGLWIVSEIANHFNAALEVIDEPSSEFPVGFKFKFNLETEH